MQNTQASAVKYCLITGATSGIGHATAMAIAKTGAHITVLCRNEEKGRDVVAQLSRLSGRQAELLVADLSCQADVRRVANEYLASNKPLDLLVNNAGVVNMHRRLTVDNIEETFAVNHLSYFLLTTLLLPRLQKSSYARVVNVASEAYKFVKSIGIDDINAQHSYKTFTIYGRSKLANILFTRELAKRLANTSVTINCLHPGAVNSSLGSQNSGLLSRVLPLLLKPFFKTPEQGAQTSIYLALSPEVAGITGQYFANKKITKLKAWAKNDIESEALWKLSEKMTEQSVA